MAHHKKPIRITGLGEARGGQIEPFEFDHCLSKPFFSPSAGFEKILRKLALCLQKGLKSAFKWVVSRINSNIKVVQGRPCATLIRATLCDLRRPWMTINDLGLLFQVGQKFGQVKIVSKFGGIAANLQGNWVKVPGCNCF